MCWCGSDVVLETIDFSPGTSRQIFAASFSLRPQRFLREFASNWQIWPTFGMPTSNPVYVEAIAWLCLDIHLSLGLASSSMFAPRICLEMKTLTNNIFGRPTWNSLLLYLENLIFLKSWSTIQYWKRLQNPPPHCFHGVFAPSFTWCRHPCCSQICCAILLPRLVLEESASSRSFAVARLRLAHRGL